MTGSLDAELFKCIIVGDSGTGKSCILNRFVDGTFNEDSNQTIGVEFASKVLSVNGRQAKLHIWDTAGQERYRSITRSYYRGASLVVIVYDISRKDSFHHVRQWMDDVSSIVHRATLLLLGNKADVCQRSDASCREVSFLEAAQFAQENGFQAHLEASAKTGDNVQEAFSLLLKKHLSRLEDGTIQTANHTTPPPDGSAAPSAEASGEKRKRKGCCGGGQ